MLVFNCSKAAADFFITTKKGEVISPIEAAPHKTIAESIGSLASDPSKVLPDDIIQSDGLDVIQWHWLVHAIKVKRKNVLIVMDYHSRFSITLSGLKKGDQYAFLNMFEHHLNVHIHELMQVVCDSSGDIQKSLAQYNKAHDSCAFHQRGDRSVQSTLNDVVWHFKESSHTQGAVPEGVDLIGFDAFVNDLLRKHKTEKEYFYPRRKFLHAWLAEYGEMTKAQADKKIQQLKDQERAEHHMRYNTLPEPNAEPNVEPNAEQNSKKNTAPSAESLLAENTEQTHDLSNVVFIDAFKNKNKH